MAKKIINIPQIPETVSLKDTEYWKTFRARYIENKGTSLQEEQLGHTNNEQNKEAQ